MISDTELRHAVNNLLALVSEFEQAGTAFVSVARDPRASVDAVTAASEHREACYVAVSDWLRVWIDTGKDAAPVSVPPSDLLTGVDDPNL